MSAGKPFFDTNVLLYLITVDGKAEKAETLLKTGGVISVQVLNEFASVSSRKYKLAWREVREALAIIRAGCEVVPLTVQIHEGALAVIEKYGFSFYDSLILAAAAEAKCRTVYSEDMQD